MTLVLCALLLPAQLRFEVTTAKGLLERPADGRMLVVLGNPADDEEPYRAVGRLGLDAAPVIGADADGFIAGKTATLGGKDLVFPCESLAKVRPGRYRVQALFDWSRDTRLPSAGGNLVSKPVEVDIAPTKGVVRLELMRKLPELEEVKDDAVRWVRLRSARLSKFWGRDMFYRAGVLLPRGWAKEKDRKYPLRVHIGGFGSRYTGVRDLFPGEFLTLMLDGAGPLGDPYQVNSANHGPWGDALTQELIPHVEKEYRGDGRRVLDGASTGGWVSLALQVYYPDFFRGCWSHCPDPVDFRDFMLMNLYRDDNGYLNPRGFERPARRNVAGDVEHTVRHEMLLERVLGRGGDWTLSGRDWGSWNAAWGPRGKDGRPVPLWDGATGKIDKAVLDHWKRYDLRMHLEANWKSLGPKLRGKVRVYVGDADDYFLNNAVERLKRFFDTAEPRYEGKVEFARRKGHGWRALSERQMLEEMAAAVKE